MTVPRHSPKFLLHGYIVGLIGLLLCLAPAFVIAQQAGPMSPMMHPAPEALIDGTKHPELISDATAYRLVFVVLGLAPDATADEQTARTLRLQNAGLSDTDVNEAIVVLDTFKNQYADLLQTFNNSVSALIASGATPDLQSFDAKRDALVQSALGELRRALSPNGIAAFNIFVQQEKRNMKAPKDAP